MSNNLSRLTSRQLWRKVDHITAVILKFLTIVVVLVGLFVIVKVEATSNDVKTVRIDGGVDVNRPAQLNKPYETVVRLEDGSVKHCIVNGTGALSCNM